MYGRAFRAGPQSCYFIFELEFFPLQFAEPAFVGGGVVQFVFDLPFRIPGWARRIGVDKPKHPQDSDPHWMDYRFEFIRAFGVDVITGLHPGSVQRGAKGTNLIGTPVLFTGDLNTMDASTKKRLAWQMDQILKFRKIFFGHDPDRQGQRVNKQIAALVMKLAQMEKSKDDLIQQGDIHAAAQFRDSSTDVRKEMLEVLLKVVGEG